MRHQRNSFIFPMILVFYEIVIYLSNDMYLPALPQMINEFKLTFSQAQLTLSTWFIGSASIPLVMGPLSDRYGRRPVILVGGLIYLTATIFCALATNFTFLLVARALEGSMVASMLVPGYACIHELYRQKEAIRILALMGSISVLAPAFGPLFGSMILYVGSWRIIFWSIAILALCLLILLTWFMPETLTIDKKQPFHLLQLYKNYVRVLKNPRYMILMLVLSFIFSAFIVWITASPLLLMETYHFNAFEFGLVQAGVFIFYIIGQTLIKYLLDRASPYRLMCIGVTISVISSLCMWPFTRFFSNGLMSFILMMIIFSFGSGFSSSPLSRIIIEASTEPMGIRMGIFSVFLSGSAAVGSGLASLYFDGSLISLVFLITVLVMMCTTLLGIYHLKYNNIALLTA